METISYLVPVYNVEKYLAKCLDSLLAQTGVNKEIVLINDGSTDHSLEICESYAKKYPEVKVYSYPNAGISATRNRALAHATGDYVMFVDSDDYISEKMSEKMMRVIREENLDVLQCGFRMDYRWFTLYRPGSRNRVMSTAEALKQLARGVNLNNYPWGKIYRRSCFNNVEFPENIPGFEDTRTIFKALANAKKIGTIPDRFYHYVQHRGSLTNRMSLQTVEGMKSAYEYQNQWLKKRFPEVPFDFSEQYYNTDMVIIYTMIVFSKRSDHVHFEMGPFEWKQIQLSAIKRFAYNAWLGVARLKLGADIAKRGYI